MPGNSTIVRLLRRLGGARSSASTAHRPASSATRSTDSLWHKAYAWYPIIPTDERRVFWLETVWRRRNQRSGWEYRSFRDEATKARELERPEIW